MRYGKPIKNKKHIDPRYFLHETQDMYEAEEYDMTIGYIPKELSPEQVNIMEYWYRWIAVYKVYKEAGEELKSGEIEKKEYNRIMTDTVKPKLQEYKPIFISYFSGQPDKVKVLMHKLGAGDWEKVVNLITGKGMWSPEEEKKAADKKTKEAAWRAYKEIRDAGGDLGEYNYNMDMKTQKAYVTIGGKKVDVSGIKAPLGDVNAYIKKFGVLGSKAGKKVHDMDLRNAQVTHAKKVLAGKK